MLHASSDSLLIYNLRIQFLFLAILYGLGLAFALPKIGGSPFNAIELITLFCLPPLLALIASGWLVSMSTAKLVNWLSSDQLPPFAPNLEMTMRVDVIILFATIVIGWATLRHDVTFYHSLFMAEAFAFAYAFKAQRGALITAGLGVGTFSVQYSIGFPGIHGTTTAGNVLGFLLPGALVLAYSLGACLLIIRRHETRRESFSSVVELLRGLSLKWSEARRSSGGTSTQESNHTISSFRSATEDLLDQVVAPDIEWWPENAILFTSYKISDGSEVYRPLIASGSKMWKLNTAIRREDFGTLPTADHPRIVRGTSFQLEDVPSFLKTDLSTNCGIFSSAVISTPARQDAAILVLWSANPSNWDATVTDYTMIASLSSLMSELILASINRRRNRLDNALLKASLATEPSERMIIVEFAKDVATAVFSSTSIILHRRRDGDCIGAIFSSGRGREIPADVVSSSIDIVEKMKNPVAWQFGERPPVLVQSVAQSLKLSRNELNLVEKGGLVTGYQSDRGTTYLIAFDRSLSTPWLWFLTEDLFMLERTAIELNKLLVRFELLTSLKDMSVVAKKNEEEAKSLAASAERRMKQTQREFMSMAHQIQEPIWEAQGHVSLIKNMETGQAFQSLSSASELLADTQLLSFSIYASIAMNLEAPVTVKPESIDALHECRSLVERFKRINRGNRLVYTEFGSEIGFPQITIDKRIFKSVMYSLFSNAYKYADHGSTIIVRAQFEADTGTPVVKFSSIGEPILPSEVEKIFEMFYRGQSVAGSSKYPEGVGLGLWVARMLLGTCGATVECIVPSDKPNLSVFLLRFPTRVTLKHKG